MRIVRAKCFLIGIVIVVYVTFGIFLIPSEAKIDAKDVVGLWLFDEGKGEAVSDASGNKHDGKIIGPPKWVDGKFAKALQIAGDNYVRVPHSETLSLKTYTITVWFSTNSGGNWIGVLSKSHNNQTRNYTIYIHKDNNTASMSIGDEAGNGWRDTSGTTKVNDGKWHHIAISFDDRARIGKVFTDGIQEGQYTVATKVPQNNADLVFAAWHHAGGNSGFAGILDEISIFSVALEEADIKDIMQKGLKSLLSSPVEFKAKLAITWGEIKSSR